MAIAAGRRPLALLIGRRTPRRALSIDARESTVSTHSLVLYPSHCGVLPAQATACSQRSSACCRQECHLPLDPARHVLEQSDDRLLRVLRLLKLVRPSLVEPIDELLDTNKPPAKSRAPMLCAYGRRRRNGPIQNSPAYIQQSRVSARVAPKGSVRDRCCYRPRRSGWPEGALL